MRGHLCSKFGVKWHHNAVSDCFKKVHELGYQVVYLTARSISMVCLMTRLCLDTQDLTNVQEYNTRRYIAELGLPPGPLLLSRKTFAGAISSEIIKKDAKFGKAEHLTSITMPHSFTFHIEQCV